MYSIKQVQKNSLTDQNGGRKKERKQLKKTLKRISASKAVKSS